jgi:hypothetical protein
MVVRYKDARKCRSLSDFIVFKETEEEYCDEDFLA